MIDDDLRARVDSWLERDPDADNRSELARLLDSGDVAELTERFGGRLEFGTSGLRAALGAGPTRMNRVVVRDAAAGFARYLGTGKKVVIGFDARHKSDVFAIDTARVVAGAGHQALVLPKFAPTPVLAFAVRHLGADAGVMCTASHNPRGDNGYKVYRADGAQISWPVDVEIATAIDFVAKNGQVRLADENDPAIVHLDDGVVRSYVEHVLGLGHDGPRDVSIVYTPMHGVGLEVVAEVFTRAGFAKLYPVEAQAVPDPEFPTLPFPNPEEDGALDLAITDARRLGADVVIANDPDADRLAAVVPSPPWTPATESDWHQLTGDEVGTLLADYVLTGTTGRNRLVVSTFVSSRMLAAIAQHHDVHHLEVLTGFKWVARAAIEHPEWKFVFGCEEALGYSVDPYVRDKDGVSAGLVFVELVAALADSGRTVWDRLEELARLHGHHATRTWSLRFTGRDASERIDGVVAGLRSEPPERLGGRAVVSTADFATGATSNLAPTNAIRLDLDGKGRIVARPSGTEQKVKFYFEDIVAVTPSLDGYALARAAGVRSLEDLRFALASHLGIEGSSPELGANDH